MTAVRHRDEILGRIVRPYTAAVGSGFLLVYENAAETMHFANILIIYIYNISNHSIITFC